MQDLLDTLNQLGIFAELDPANPDAMRQLFASLVANGELTFRRDPLGTLFAKFFNESLEFRVQPGVFRYTPDAGLTLRSG